MQLSQQQKHSSQPNNLYLIHLAVELIDTLPQQMETQGCDYTNRNGVKASYICSKVS